MLVQGERQGVVIRSSSSSDNNDNNIDTIDDAVGEVNKNTSKKAQKALRKQKAKEMKHLRRLKREGKANETVGNKDCERCSKSSDLLIRCQIDQSKTWYLVCGACWKHVSGGVVDGTQDKPHYKYGGLWKNRTLKK